MKKKPKKKKLVGRPAQFNGTIRVPIDTKMREDFHKLCVTNDPPCKMTEAIRHFIMLCNVNKTILGLAQDE